MIKKLSLIIYIAGAMSASTIYAGSGVPCPPIKVQSTNNIIFLPGTSSHTANAVYFIENVSKYDVTVDHPNHRAGAQAGFASTLSPGHWSALQLSRPNYALSCTAQNPGHTVPLDCKKVLVVCVPPNLTVKTAGPGTYWLIENKELKVFLKELPRKGLEMVSVN